MIALALAIAILQSTSDQQTDQGFEGIWTEYGDAMLAEGISHDMGRLAFQWSEGQYHLGICRAYLAADDVEHWRHWWDATPLPQGPVGRRIIQTGDEAYTEGLETALTAPLTRDHCVRVAESWIADMRILTAQ